MHSHIKVRHMKKVIITVEEVEEEPGTIYNAEDRIEINFDTTVIPVELHEWIMEHVGNRPRDRG
jgi:hypothetical protein